MGLITAACVPLPLQLVVDDVGWWSGCDGHERGEPFRTGIDRDHTPADYLAIVQLGRELDVRPQAAMILCEWDRQNILRAVPTSTWMGEDWDNRRWVGPWLDEAAAVFGDHPEHIELTLHGVGHEYWQDGIPTRAEWYDEDKVMRPRDSVLAHLDACERILRQNDLGDFPVSFVPAAFRYCYGDGDGGLAAILHAAGITYISTPYSSMGRRAHPQADILGIDQDVVTVDRGACGIPWDTIAADPPEDIQGAILGLHWPNILHPDPAQSSTVVGRWVASLRAHDQRFDKMLAADSAVHQTQLAYHLGTRVTIRETGLTCHFDGLEPLSRADVAHACSLKVAAPADVEFTSTGADLVGCQRQGDHWQLEMRPSPGREPVRIEARPPCCPGRALSTLPTMPAPDIAHTTVKRSTHVTKRTAADNMQQHLGGNPYPGRGLVIGRSDQEEWIQLYWIMGRSPNSRNRVFAAEGDILRTEAADPSKVEDPSLIIYNAIRRSGKRFIVTNGKQTDTVFEGFGAGRSFVDSLLTERHEPDPPNFTPRISGCLDLSTGDPSLWLSVIEASPFDSDHSGHHFFHYTSVPPGHGYCVTTYQGDGDPLPSFEGAPLLMPLVGSADEIAQGYWDVLDEENRISLAVQRIDSDGLIASISVINKYTR